MTKSTPAPSAGSKIQSELKEAMRRFPQGVTVVTTHSNDGPKGMTVSSFTSVSLDPPLVLVSIAKESDVHDFLVSSDSFAVNFLTEDESSLSDLFASRIASREKFGSTKHHSGVTGSPIIDGARTVIECKTWHVNDGGDHSLILGEVVRATADTTRRPLVYHNQLYTRLESPSSASLPPGT